MNAQYNNKYESPFNRDPQPNWHEVTEQERIDAANKLADLIAETHNELFGE